MTENSNMNIIDVNSDEDISDLESSKSHMLALFATLGKKETDLKNEKQKLKVELNESQKKNERLLQEIEKVKGEKQTLQKNLEDVQNEKEQKDTQNESLNLELTELKQAVQSFLSGEIGITLKSLSNLVKTSKPKQGENVQRAEMSHSNDEEEQVSDPMSDQQAVQIPDSQLKTISEEQEQQQQPMEVTEHESIIAHPTETLPNQVLSLGKVIDRIDAKSDRTYDDRLVGKKIRCNYETGLDIGKIKYFNFKLKEFRVLFDDGSEDYIKEVDIDGKELILLNDDSATSVHEKKKNKCSKCDASFRCKKSLKKHIASDHDEKTPGKCPLNKKIEGKGKKVKRNLKNHDKLEYTELNSDEEVRHVSSKGKIIKEVTPIRPIILKRKNKKWSKVKKEVSEDEYSPITKVSIQKGWGARLVWLFSKRRPMPNDARTLGLQTGPQKLDKIANFSIKEEQFDQEENIDTNQSEGEDPEKPKKKVVSKRLKTSKKFSCCECAKSFFYKQILKYHVNRVHRKKKSGGRLNGKETYAHPNDEKFDFSAGLSDPKRKVARKPQGLDLLLDKRIHLKLAEEKEWLTERVYSNTDASGKIFLKSTETMANDKVIKAMNGPKKLARQPFINAACMNVPEGLFHASPAQILPPNPGEENIKIEIEIPEIFNPEFENVSMAKRPKLSLPEKDVLEKTN